MKNKIPFKPSDDMPTRRRLNFSPRFRTSQSLNTPAARLAMMAGTKMMEVTNFILDSEKNRPCCKYRGIHAIKKYMPHCEQKKDNTSAIRLRLLIIFPKEIV